MTTQSWLKQITPEIFETLSLSDQGSIPPFSFEEFSNLLKEGLGQESLSCSALKMDFIEGDAYFEGLTNKTIMIPITAYPLKGKGFFVMSHQDIQSLIRNMMNEDSSSLTLENEPMMKGLYTYFIAEALDSIAQMEDFADLALKISEGMMTDLSAYAIDVSINIGKDKLLGRLLLTKELYKSIHNHFKFTEPTLENLENIPEVNVPVTLTTGSFTMTPKELSSIESGDFIILDNTFYKPLEKKGSFQMAIGKTPIMQVKTSKDGLKVLDYIYFTEEETMDEEQFGDDDSTFDEDFDEFENDLPQGPEDNYDDSSMDDPLMDGEGSHEMDEMPEGMPPLKQESATESLDEIDKGFEEEDNDSMQPEKTSLSQVPLTVNVEVARFNLSLEELKKMTPGFKLPVNINPLAVNLVVGGKSIGTGEIIQIGETTGVKVIKLNK